MDICVGFGPLMDVDKLIHMRHTCTILPCFGPLMDVDKLISADGLSGRKICFGSLMDVDKLIPSAPAYSQAGVLGL